MTKSDWIAVTIAIVLTLGGVLLYEFVIDNPDEESVKVETSLVVEAE